MWMNLFKFPNPSRRTMRQTPVLTSAFTFSGNERDDEIFSCNAQAGAFTVTISPALFTPGDTFAFIKTDNSAFYVRIDAGAGKTIDGVNRYAYLLNRNDGLIITCMSASAWAISATSGDRVSGWNDYIIGANGSKQTNQDDPTWKEIGTSGVWGWHFSPTADNRIVLPLPYHPNHDYKTDSPIFPHIHWEPTSTDAGVVRWGVTFRYAVRNDETPAVFQTTTFYIEQAASGTSNTHQVAEVAEPGVLGGGALAIDSVSYIVLFRDADHANDTYPGEAVPSCCDIHYQCGQHATPSRAPDFFTPV